MVAPEFNTPNWSHRIDTLVIGAGQAGLSMGYHLSRNGLDHVIVDGAERIGELLAKPLGQPASLHARSLRRIGLLAVPGSAFLLPDQGRDGGLPGGATRPAHFQLPVRLGFRVDRLSRHDGRYLVAGGDEVIEADNVVVAMGDLQVGEVPSLSVELDPSIFQMHSSEYHRPEQLPAGDVLVVGAGNSGAEIALDLARAGVVVSGSRAASPGTCPSTSRERSGDTLHRGS